MLFRFVVSCEYLIDGETCAVTHLHDWEGRRMVNDYFRAEKFAFIQEGDPLCVGAYVIMADGIPL